MEMFVVDDGDPDMEVYLGVAAVPLASLVSIPRRGGSLAPGTLISVPLQVQGL